jgi:hypothetical protein
MNIVKLQEDLKNVPINNLISYVQNPNGQVPSYLALSEIKRRKDMESRAVAAKNTPSSTSVAEELTMPRQPMPMQMAQAQPQPQMEAGVASLPTGDMYQDQSFAGGGIVAFADGGDTGMNLDQLPTLNVNTGQQNYGNYDISGASPEYKNLMRAFGMAGEMNTINPGARVFSRMMSGLLSGDPEMIGMIQGKGAPSSLIRGFDDPAYANNPQWAVPAGYVPTAPAVSINPSLGNTGYQNSAFVNRKAKGGEVQHFANEGAVVFDRNMGPATFDAELDDPSIDAYTRDLILRNRSMFGSNAPIQVAGEVNPALSSSQLGQSYWQNLKRKFALQKQKEARDIAVENERQLKFYGGAGGYKSKESPIMSNKEAAMAADAAMAKENQEGPKGITQDMINKLNAGAPAGGGIGGLRPNLAATKEKSLDEMIEDRRKLLESQGVKTDYYSKMIEDLRKEKGEELDSSKRMMKANILFSLAKSVGETPGGIMRGLTKGATEVGPAVMQGLKDQREIEKLNKKEERAMASLERAEKRGDTDAIEKARDKYEQIKADKEGRIISGEYSLAASRIASKPTTFEQVMSGLRGNKAYYKMVDGKPVFDTEKAYNTYLGTKSGAGISETTLLKEYNDLGGQSGTGMDWETYKATFGNKGGATTSAVRPKLLGYENQ